MVRDKERQLSPDKASRIYGKFTPSPAKEVMTPVRKGVVKREYMNRAERRANGQY